MKYKLLHWCNDKGRYIFDALKSVCDDLPSKIKGSKFHFEDSINRRIRQPFMGKGNNPKNLLPNHCTARLSKAAKTFGWLKWWHDRQNFVLGLFQGYEDSISNQAEVV